MVKENMSFIAQYDPEIAATLEAEMARQKRNIELMIKEAVNLKNLFFEQFHMYPLRLNNQNNDSITHKEYKIKNI